MNIKHFLTASTLLLSANCFAQSTFEEGGLMYMEDLSDPSKMAVIVVPKFNQVTGQGMYSGNVVVPATIEHDLDTYEVVGLGTSCFCMCPNLTGVEIKAPLKTLPMGAIAGDPRGDKLKTIKLPDTLEEIPAMAMEAPNVENLYLGKKLKTVTGVFSNLNSLTELNFPTTIETILAAFGECNKIKTLNLTGDNLTMLAGAFGTMQALESLTIKGKDLVIDNCFLECSDKLKTITLSGVKTINEAFREINIDKLVLPEGITDLTRSFGRFNGSELTLPNSLTKVEYCFYKCPNLKVAHLSKGVCDICVSLNGKGETIYCPWNEVPKAPSSLKKYDKNFEVTFVVPVGMEAKYREAWADELNNAESTINFREEKF